MGLSQSSNAQQLPVEHSRNAFSLIYAARIRSAKWSLPFKDRLGRFLLPRGLGEVTMAGVGMAEAW